MNKHKKRKGIIGAFNDAIAGIIYTLKFERNMKIHYFISVFVLIVSLFLNLTKVEMILLFMSICFVIVAELFNTAVEKVVDLVTDEYHILAKIAKDMAAGAVLVAALNSVVVAYILFYDKLSYLSSAMIYKLRESELHITLICIVLVLIAVVIVKAFTFTGTPLKGGMPSGHAALAFAIATGITLMTERVVASTLAYIMAVLVAQSRIEGKIHSFWETFAGALLGILIAISVFQFGMFYNR